MTSLISCPLFSLFTSLHHNITNIHPPSLSLSLSLLLCPISSSCPPSLSSFSVYNFPHFLFFCRPPLPSLPLHFHFFQPWCTTCPALSLSLSSLSLSLLPLQREAPTSWSVALWVQSLGGRWACVSTWAPPSPEPCTSWEPSRSFWWVHLHPVLEGFTRNMNSDQIKIFYHSDVKIEWKCFPLHPPDVHST